MWVDMATAKALIDEALKALRVYQPDADITDQEYEDALTRLNHMMEQWAEAIETLGVSTLTTVAPTGINPITLGPTGDVTMTRPISIPWVSWGPMPNREMPLDMVSWVKTEELKLRRFSPASGPMAAHYRPTPVNGELWLQPIPYGGTLTVQSLCPLYTWATLTTDVPLPIGLERAVFLNLAIDLGGTYQLSVGDDLKALAADSLKHAAGIAEVI
jgi:hypothetical protein